MPYNLCATSVTLWGFCVGSVLGGILWEYVGRVLVEKGTQT